MMDPFKPGQALSSREEAMAAFLAGAKVQFKALDDTPWFTIQSDTERLSFNSKYSYRIAPREIRYRNFSWTTAVGITTVCVVIDKDQEREPRENWKKFNGWLGDWQTMEVFE